LAKLQPLYLKEIEFHRCLSAEEGNENPYPPSPHVLEAIAAVTPEQLRRYPDPVANRFRDAAAKLFGVTRDMVICGNGMDDILNIAIRAFTGP
jgi:histidinol-phosphate aminotransferase